jgi:carbamoyltransferase
VATVLGVVGEPQHGAAALAIDGRIVAAAEERAAASSDPGCGHTHPWPLQAIAACLRVADREADSIDRLAIIGDARTRHQSVKLRDTVSCDCGAGALIDALLTVEHTMVAAPFARAAQATTDGDVVVLAIETEPCPAAHVFVRRGPRLKSAGAIDGISGVAGVVRMVAGALRIAPHRAFLMLDRMSATGEPEFEGEFARAIQWESGDVRRAARSGGHARIVVHDTIVDELLARVGESKHANVAASLRARLASLVVEIGRDLRDRLHIERIALSGGWCASPRLNTAVVSALGTPTTVAPVPTREGLALGAALAVFDEAAPIETLALGPSFSESEMKLALDNCRLDYVYEPDWSRLLRRVSSMLAQGKTIAWFHGATDFGPRSLGGRSVLADPSNRYARANVNQFLKGRPQTYPLPVSIAEAIVPGCLDAAPASPFMQYRTSVRNERRHQVRAALEGADQLWYHTVSQQEAPALANLLATHHRATGVPGLINVNLSGHHEPTACTPRDAIRTTFSSAVDALVMGRFLVMKDYWLLRSDEADA